MSDLLFQNSQDIGELRATVRSMGERITRLEQKIDELLEAVQTARGGFKMAMIIGSACAALGGAIAWIISHLRIT